MDIIVENVSYINKKKKYIKNINFEIRAGKICGIIGNIYENILKLIELMSGNIKPTSGNIYLLSLNCKERSIKANKAIGYCSKKNDIKSKLKVYDYIEKKGEKFIKDKEELNKRIKDLLEFVNIRNCDIRYNDLTYSEKYRLLIATELIKDPEVLIIDLYGIELDKVDRSNIIDLIDRLKETMTIIISTNNFNDINSICDKVIVIKNDKIILDSNVKKIKDRYKNKKAIILKIAGKISLYEFISEIEKYSWVDKVSGYTNGRLRIYVNSYEEANFQIPQIIHKRKLELMEYFSKSHSFEDEYLKIMGD
jgi:ABC-type multidrug transport system ATPase subunit